MTHELDRLEEKLSLAGLGLGSEDRTAYVARVHLSVADCDTLRSLISQTRATAGLVEALEEIRNLSEGGSGQFVYTIATGALATYRGRSA